MAKKLDEESSNAALLRTTADVASHALTQIEVCADKWPEFRQTTIREFVERVVVRAKEYGYIEKRGKV